MEPETQGSSLTYFRYLAACRCDTLIALGRFQEALIDAEIASRLCPDAPEGNIARGRALMALGRGNEALDAYEAAIDRADDPLSEELTAERDRAAAFVLSNQLSPAELQ